QPGRTEERSEAVEAGSGRVGEVAAGARGKAGMFSPKPGSVRGRVEREEVFR
ncbi:MAG: hypothetical protein H5T61_15710, partial [Thermoflexales bacterium]|nr:hypothetical protein [Thermoflexales bacterium]